MALVKYESQSKDLSEVLVKVKQDLLKLREKIEVSYGSGQFVCLFVYF